MLALRINRINGDWNAYWKAVAQPSSAVANDNSPQKITAPYRVIASVWIAPESATIAC